MTDPSLPLTRQTSSPVYPAMLNAQQFQAKNLLLDPGIDREKKGPLVSNEDYYSG
jgi:hypothetical protein